jgi:iron complex outermembrane recepter protein
MTRNLKIHATLTLWVSSLVFSGVSSARSVDFSIESQPLQTAIYAWAQQTGCQVLMPGEAGLQAGLVPDIRGKYTPENALREMLASSGLTYRFVNAHTVAISSGVSTVDADSGGSPAIGSGEADSSAQQISEVVVTARKRQEAALEVPFAVNAFNAAALSDAHVEGFQDLSGSIPNFLFSSSRSIDSTVTLRGIGVSTGFSPPGVGLYVDGIYQNSPSAFNLPFFGVDHIEVAKGPQGTLYGRNSIGGAINVVTAAPSKNPEAGVELEMGSGDTHKGAFSVAGPIFGDAVAGRLTAGAQRRGGFYRFSDGADADTDDYDAVNGRLLIDFSKNISADLKLYYFKKDGSSWALENVANINDTSGQIKLTPVFQHGPYTGDRQFDGINNRGATLSLKYSAAHFEVASISGYDDQKDFTLYDVDNSPADVVNVRTNSTRSITTQELRAYSTDGGPLTWLVGAFYTHGDLGGDNTLSGSLFANSLFQPFKVIATKGYAGFTDVEYAFTNKLSVGTGVRFDSLHKDVEGTTLSGTFESWQPKASLKYSISGNSRVYLTVAKGFREGGFNPGLVGTSLANYPNDSLWSYELGTKASFLDRRGNLDFAVFYIDASQLNGQALLFVPSLGGFRTVTVPIGGVRSEGAELSLNYRFGNAFNLSLDAGYDNAEPTTLSANVQPGTAAKGKQLIYAPLWNTRLSGEWRVQTGTRLTTRLIAAVTGVGPTNFPGSTVTPGTLAQRDPYFLGDVSANFDLDKYSLSLFVKNVTDKKYATSYIDATTFQAFGGKGDAVTYNIPRYFGVLLKARF